MERGRVFWNRIWNWKYLLRPHPVVTAALSVASGIGLIWVFTSGMDFTLAAYLLYGISAYALLILGILFYNRLPWLKIHFHRDPMVRKVLKDDSVFSISMYVEQCINFCYGSFKIISGMIVGSAWIGADGIYNFTQGCIQLYQILRHKTVKGCISNGKYIVPAVIW